MTLGKFDNSVIWRKEIFTQGKQAFHMAWLYDILEGNIRGDKIRSVPLNLMIKTKRVRRLSSENKKSQSLFQTSDEFLFIKEYSISSISGSWYYVYKGTILSSFITHSHLRETGPSTNDRDWDQGELQGYIRDFLAPYTCLVSYSQDDA